MRPPLPLLLLLPLALPAQNPPSPPTTPAPTDPALVALLAKAAAARPAPAPGKADSLTMAGDYRVFFAGKDQPVAKGTYREAFVGADLAFHRSDMGPMGALERGIQGELVWELDPAMGARARRGPFAAHVRRYCALLRGADLRQTYRQFERTGTDRVDGVDVTVLRLGAAEAEGAPDTAYLDADGRIRRFDMRLPTPELNDASARVEDMELAQIHFADFGTDGLPKRRTIQMGTARVEFVATSLERGNDVDAKTFVPPKAVQQLQPEPEQPMVGPDGKPLYHRIERQEQRVASIRTRVKIKDISLELATLLPEVMTHIHGSGGKEAGPPFTRYHGEHGDEVDLEAGIPVHQPIAEKGRIKNSTLPGGKTVTCWHIGPYDKLSTAHAALDAWLTKNGAKKRGGAYEVYWTDPGMVPDPAKWKTQIFAPID